MPLLPLPKFVPKSGRLVQPREATRLAESRGFQIQDILPLIGGIGGALVPGVGPILGPAIGGALGKLGERGISAARGERVSLPEAGLSALGEGALFGTLGVAGKVIGAGVRGARASGGFIPKASEVLVGTPRTTVTTAFRHPELVEEFKTGARTLADVTSKLGRATKTFVTKSRLDFKQGLAEVAEQNTGKVLDTKSLGKEIQNLVQEFNFPVVKGKVSLKSGPLIGEQVTRLKRIIQEITKATRKGKLNLEQSRSLVQRIRRLSKVSPTPENETFLGLTGRITGTIQNKSVNTFKGLAELNKRYSTQIKDVVRLRKALGEASTNPDTAEVFVRSLVRKSKEMLPQSRFASREMIQRLEKETGEEILNELDAFDAAKRAMETFEGAIGQPLVTARTLLGKGVLRGAQEAGRIRARGIRLPGR